MNFSFTINKYFDDNWKFYFSQSLFSHPEPEVHFMKNLTLFKDQRFATYSMWMTVEGEYKKWYFHQLKTSLSDVKKKKILYLVARLRKMGPRILRLENYPACPSSPVSNADVVVGYGTIPACVTHGWGSYRYAQVL